MKELYNVGVLREFKLKYSNMTEFVKGIYNLEHKIYLLRALKSTLKRTFWCQVVVVKFTKSIETYIGIISVLISSSVKSAYAFFSDPITYCNSHFASVSIAEFWTWYFTQKL